MSPDALDLAINVQVYTELVRWYAASAHYQHSSIACENVELARGYAETVRRYAEDARREGWK